MMSRSQNALCSLDLGASMAASYSEVPLSKANSKNQGAIEQQNGGSNETNPNSLDQPFIKTSESKVNIFDVINSTLKCCNVPGWAAVYLSDGPLILLGGFGLYLLIAIAVNSGAYERTSVYLSTSTTFTISYGYLTWRIFAPKAWEGSRFALYVLGFSLICGGAIFISASEEVMTLPRSAKAVIVCINAAICVFTAYVYPSIVYFKTYEAWPRFSRRHMFVWGLIIFPALHFTSLIFQDFDHNVQHILLLTEALYLMMLTISNLAFIKYFKLSIKTYGGTDFPLVLTCVTTVGNGSIGIVYFWSYVRHAVGRESVATVGLLFNYAATSFATVLVWELVSIIRKRHRGVFELPLFSLQFFQEFAVHSQLLFVDFLSTGYIIILLIIAFNDILVKSGILYENYYRFMKSDKSSLGMAIYMAKKYQFIRQKVFAQGFVTPLLLLMLLAEYTFGDKIGFTLIKSSKNLKENSKLEGYMIGYTIALAMTVLTSWLGNTLLNRRMDRIRINASALDSDQKRLSDFGDTNDPNSVKKTATLPNVEPDRNEFDLDIRDEYGVDIDFRTHNYTSFDHKDETSSISHGKENNEQTNEHLSMKSFIQDENFSLDDRCTTFLRSRTDKSMKASIENNLLESEIKLKESNGVSLRPSQSNFNRSKNDLNSTMVGTKIAQEYQLEYPLLNPVGYIGLFDDYLERHMQHRSMFLIGGIVGMNAGLLWIFVSSSSEQSSLISSPF